jgi:hypothetical protein
MAKVIKTIAAENGMDFQDIMSFKTDNYIGIYDNAKGEFALMYKSGTYFEPTYLKYVSSLGKLDDLVFEECEEHITEVFDRSDYVLTLDCEVR